MSTIKVNTVTTRSGCTVTLGESGKTVALASGASQSGFGRTGTVDWDTTAKTASFTAVSGNGYFVNTTSGAITVTLPLSPSAGDIISLADYTNTWQTNNVTIARNGSNIGGVAKNANLGTEGQSVTFVYVDSTEGWKNVQDSTSNVIGNQFMVATGGTITTCGNCKIHTFTGPGTFCVASVHPCSANNVVSYMVVAGGGGGGDGGTTEAGGGGGAGGFREDKSPVTPYTASPLDGAGAITVTATAFPITVGGGGSPGCSSPGGGNTPGTAGSNSVFSTITSAGGGGGISGGASATAGPTNAGGSGSGGNGRAHPAGRSGNTPPVSPSQGNDGGSGSNTGPHQYSGGGGGGAGGTGGNSSCSSPRGGAGGNGVSTSITGSSVAYAGGGGGGTRCNSGDPSPANSGGGAGGTGNGTTAPSGTANRGGGGGGTGGPNTNGGSGGSGIVVIRYKFQ